MTSQHQQARCSPDPPSSLCRCWTGVGLSIVVFTLTWSLFITDNRPPLTLRPVRRPAWHYLLPLPPKWCLHDTTGCTASWMFAYPMHPVAQPTVQPVWQPGVSCVHKFSCWTNWLCNRLYEFNIFDLCNLSSNRARRVNRLKPGWVNYANEPSQQGLEWASQDADDVIVLTQQSDCVDSRQCNVFDGYLKQNYYFFGRQTVWLDVCIQTTPKLLKCPIITLLGRAGMQYLTLNVRFLAACMNMYIQMFCPASCTSGCVM